MAQWIVGSVSHGAGARRLLPRLLLGIDAAAVCRRCDDLAVIAALTAFVAFEKLAPVGRKGAQVSGALLLALGTWMLLAS
jgi:predicted metal-binding membrane protein